MPCAKDPLNRQWYAPIASVSSNAVLTTTRRGASSTPSPLRDIQSGCGTYQKHARHVGRGIEARQGHEVCKLAEGLVVRGSVVALGA